MSEPTATTPPSRSSFLTPLSIALTSRIGLMLPVYLGLTLMPTRTFSERMPGNFLLNGWFKWDAGWYELVANKGYTNLPQPGTQERDTNYFPLYPLLVRGAGHLVGDFYLGGWLVSNFSFLIAAVLLFRLVEARWGAELASRTLVLMCVYPFSYTYSAMYTESPFLLFALASFWFAERSRWLPASLCAGAAWSIRLVGVASVVALVIMYLEQAQWRWKNIRWNAAWLLLSGAGVAAFMVFLWLRFDEPLAFIHTQQVANWSDIHTWKAFENVISHWRESMTFGFIASGDLPLLQTMHLLAVAAAFVLCAIAWRRLPIAYSAFATIITLISIYRWACYGRHFTTIFPAFIVAAMLLRDQKLYHGVVYISILLLALLALMFTHGLWVA